MPVIALAGNKGGTGKTTLAVNLATCLARRGGAAIIDADPQGSALQWRAFASNQDAVQVFAYRDDLHGQVNELARHHQYIVIDCPPSVHAPRALAVLRSCDIAVVPVQPSPVDLWATVHIEDAVSRAREHNQRLRALIVINQLEPRTVLSKMVRDALSEISIPVARTALRRRAIFRGSILEGKTVLDMGRRGAEAARELEQLTDEVETT